mgnify:CR=1 FL=1
MATGKKQKQQRVQKADRLAYIWWNHRRVRPKHQVVPVDVAGFAKLEKTMRRMSRIKGEQRRPANLVVDPDHPLPGYTSDEYIWAPPLRPSECCICPDGSGSARVLHRLRESLHMPPMPISQYGDCSPACPFCGLHGIAYSPYRRYDYPYGYTANSGLTILLVPPLPTEARRLAYGLDLPLAPHACYDLTTAMTGAVRAAFDGRAVNLPLPAREAILIALRQSHHATHANIIRERRARKHDELEEGNRVALSYQDAALHFVIPFWTNVCYFPDRNFPERDECIHPIFTKTIQQGELRLVGNFAVPRDYYDDWREHLEPLGAVLDV